MWSFGRLLQAMPVRIINGEKESFLQKVYKSFLLLIFTRKNRHDTMVKTDAERLAMTKQEFINKLRISLNGKVSPGVVTENINYYEDYINTEIRNGRTEAEVLASLGDPRLIARTIAETNGMENGGCQASEDTEYREYEQNGYGGYGDSSFYGQQDKKSSRVFKVPGWVWILVSVLVVVLVIQPVLFHSFIFNADYTAGSSCGFSGEAV